MAVFLPLLHTISINLSESELTSLKFLCREKIPKRKLENVNSGVGLFTILIELKEISSDDVGFIRELLIHIKRQDLVEKLDNYAENGSNEAVDQLHPREREQLNAAFMVICDNVGRDWKMLIRRLGVPDTKMEGIIAAYPFQMQEQLMQSLKEWQKRKGADARVADLLTALQQSRMTLVAEIVEEKLKTLPATP
ncbi:FAS-associated death domain protein [Ambystoma mexicanum]|uniref:FAS-associated death domain protein n=1 Tax=Ambystoma mexicanum TaxID=8296 RepID=UPI0037E7BB3D